MDGKRFDNLTRAVGRATSRRRALALLAGGTAAFAVPAIARGIGAAWAGERGNLAAAPSFQCSGTNVVEVPCDQVRAYLDECGMYCPDGELELSAFGCTSFESDYEVTVLAQSVDPDPFRGYRAQQTVKVRWYVTFLASSVIDIRPPGVCCEAACYDAVQTWRLAVDEQHESKHRAFAYALLDDSNSTWESRRFEATGSSPELAERAVGEKVARAIEAEDDAIADRWNHAPEPPGGPGQPPCATCTPKQSDCDSCHGGNCRRTFCPPGETCCPYGNDVVCYRPAEEYCCSPDTGGGFCPHDWVCCTPEDGGGCCQPGTRCAVDGCHVSGSADNADRLAVLPKRSRN